MPAAVPKPILCFGPFELEPSSGRLRRSGIAIPLQPHPAKVLVLLASRPGQIVTREEIKSELWDGGTYVQFEQGLNFCVRRIRLALGDDADSPVYIETVPRVGYRFIAPVTTENIPQLSTGRSPGDAPLANSRRFPNTFPILIAFTVILVAVFALVWWRRSSSQVGSRRVMVAVLPFENLTGNAGEEYFADGLTEELITQLGSASPDVMGVIARTSAMHYKTSDLTVSEIGRQLGVNYILEGSVRGSPPHTMRISAQLIQVGDQTHLWARDFDVDGPDIVQVEGAVCREIATQIELHLPTKQQHRFDASRRVDPEAHDLYLRGRYAWNRRDPVHLQQALALFQESVTKDPTYAPAYSGLADTYALLGAAGYDVLATSTAMENAKAAARKAVSLDDNLSEAHASLAFVLYSYDWHLKEAEEEFRKAIALNAADATARQWYSEYLSDVGRWTEAIAQARAAVAIDPLSPIIRENLARPYYYSRQFDTAVRLSNDTLSLDPGFGIAHLRLGRELAAKGDYGEAIRQFHTFAESAGDKSLALASLANAEGRMGRKREARGLIDELRQMAANHRVPSYQFAIAYAGIDDTENEIHWLQRAYDERSDYLLSINVEPLFDNLRQDARFQQIVSRIGLTRMETSTATAYGAAAAAQPN